MPLTHTVADYLASALDAMNDVNNNLDDVTSDLKYARTAGLTDWQEICQTGDAAREALTQFRRAIECAQAKHPVPE